MGNSKGKQMGKGCSLTRREFVTMAGTFAAYRTFGATVPPDVQPLVRFGIVTDLHYADIKPAGRGKTARHYRESLKKLSVAVGTFNGDRLDFAVELGDIKDLTVGKNATLAALDRIEAEFAKFTGPRYHVAGNHDFDCLTPEEFFSRTPNGGKVIEKGYYSFVCNGVTFIVLDGCYTSDMKHYSRSNPWTDANIPAEQLAWLGRELAAVKGHAVVFCHQRLDPSAERHHLMKNAAEVRSVLEKSGKVRAVLTGHEHTGGQCVVNGIPYYTLAAMVCGSGAASNCFAEAAVYPNGTFGVKGYFCAKSFNV